MLSKLCYENSKDLSTHPAEYSYMLLKIRWECKSGRHQM